MKRILGIVSGKGGVGKSTCALGLGVALCRQGKSVLLIDLDVGLRCLDIMTRVDDRLVFDLSDVLEGKALQEAVLPVPDCNGLSLLAAPKLATAIDGKRLAEMLLLANEYDYIILDFPAGTDFPYIADIADITDFIVVTNADAVSVRDSAEMSDILRNFGTDCRLIINKYTVPLVKCGVYGGIDDIIDRSQLRLLGIVPYDEDSIRKPFAVFKRKNFKQKALGRIALRITGQSVRLPKHKKIGKGK